MKLVFNPFTSKFDWVQPTTYFLTSLTYYQDSTSIDFAYTYPTLTAYVIPSGIPHNSLASLQGGLVNEFFHLSGSIASVAGQQANASLSGFLSFQDWYNFSNLVSFPTLPLVVADSSTIDFTLSSPTLTASVIPSGIGHNSLASLQGGVVNEYWHLSGSLATVASRPANGSLSGFLLGTDWNTFSNLISYPTLPLTVVSSSTVSFTLSAPTLTANVLLTGIPHGSLASLQGGTVGQYFHLSGSIASIAVQQANGSLSGYLAGSDWRNFSNLISTPTLPMVVADSATIDFTLSAPTLTATIIPGGIVHSSLASLGIDSHTQYALLAGRSGGQTLIGGTVASNSLTLQSTSSGIKGKILFGTSAYDEANDRLGIDTSSPDITFQVNPTLVPILGASNLLQGAFNDTTANPTGSSYVLSTIGKPTFSTIFNGAYAAVLNDVYIPASSGVSITGSIYGQRNYVRTDNTTGSAILAGLFNFTDVTGTSNAATVYGSLDVARSASTGLASVLYGILGRAITTSIGGSATTMAGVRGEGTGAGTITNLYSYLGQTTVNASTTVTNVYGMRILALSNAGTATNTFGLRIDSQTTGTQTNAAFALYQTGASDFNYLAGKVGLGATSGTETLNVNGTARVYGTGTYDEYTTNAGVYIGSPTSDNPRIMFANGTSSQNWQIDTSYGIFRWYLPGYEMMRINKAAGANAGILTLYNENSTHFSVEPGYLYYNTSFGYDIMSISAASAGTAGSYLQLTANDTTAGSSNIAGGAIILNAGRGTGTGASNFIVKTGATAAATTLQTLTERFRIDNAGRVGIGDFSASTSNFDLSFSNSAAKTVGIETSASGTVGRALTISAGNTIANTNIAGGNLTLNAGRASGSGTSSILLQNGASTTSGTLQTLTTRLTIDNAGLWTLWDGTTINTGTTTGTKIGTATTQKIALWNNTPIVQPASANQAVLATNATLTQVVTLLNEIRNALATIGVIKGSA